MKKGGQSRGFWHAAHLGNAFFKLFGVNIFNGASFQYSFHVRLDLLKEESLSRPKKETKNETLIKGTICTSATSSKKG